MCAANNCPGDAECDTSTNCKCSDCKTDLDCTSGETCCDRQCAITCDNDPTTTTTPATTTTTTATTSTTPATTTSTPTTTTPKPTTTNTPCPTECCSDEECPEGYICENGECKKHCTNDADCGDVNAICNQNYDNCQYCSAAQDSWTTRSRSITRTGCLLSSWLPKMTALLVANMPTSTST